MDAIVTAGGIPQPGEPLYEYTRGKSKALLDVAGKPMIQWVLDALDGAASIQQVVIIGLESESGVSSQKTVAFLPNQGGMVENIRTGVLKALDLDPQAKHVLLVSSDIPGITPEMIDWVIASAMQTDQDVYYNVIPRNDMERVFPESKRSYTHLKGLEVCGGDMNIIRSSMVTSNESIWNDLIASRKNVLKQAALIGFDTLLLLLLQRLTIDDAVKRVTRRLHITGRAIVCPYAEVGMDVDKPHQLELLRAYLERRKLAQGAAAS
jgi:GTP:adenosylcobinamide-phosphate guanylyltransferase